MINLIVYIVEQHSLSKSFYTETYYATADLKMGAKTRIPRQEDLRNLSSSSAQSLK